MPLTDYDSPWKEILDGYFAEFLSFFFPEIAADINWAYGYESLDTELQQIVRDATLGRRFADKLLRVQRRDGLPQMVLIHTEIQGAPEPDFPKRLYVYHYRIFDRYEAPVVSLAVLGDPGRRWRPTCYAYQLWGCELRFQFPVVKLRDYRQRRAELAASTNPFAVVVLAHLEAQSTQRRMPSRLQAKLRLLRQLYTRGFTRQAILDVFRFIDWVMTLPPELEKRFQQELVQLETETQMPYVTSLERLGIEQGLQQGLQQGAAQVLARLLVHRFGPLPESITVRLAQASLTDLERWAEQALEARQLDDVFTEE